MSGEQDQLERATRALREATPPTQDELVAGRARLLAAHRGALKSSRVRTLRWVLPLAAVLAAGSALAATPEAFERVARAVSSLLAPATHQLATAKPKRAQPVLAPAAKPIEPSVAAAPLPTPAPAPVAAEPRSTDTALERADSKLEQSARAGRRPRRAERIEPVQPELVVEPPVERTEPVEVAKPAPEPAIDRDLASYREAHRAHFRARDFRAALRGWDAYLADYPHGTFVVEARYNRAICLVRLGHEDDARRALTPFARGAVEHGYRQAEAKKLLEALE